MLRHVVVFRWNEGVTDGEITAIEEGLATLPGLIPEISGYRFGRDAGINDGNFDFAVVADFASAEDYRVYRDHTAHRAVIAERVTGRVAERVAVQLEY